MNAHLILTTSSLIFLSFAIGKNMEQSKSGLLFIILSAISLIILNFIGINGDAFALFTNTGFKTYIASFIALCIIFAIITILILRSHNGNNKITDISLYVFFGSIGVNIIIAPFFIDFYRSTTQHNNISEFIIFLALNNISILGLIALLISNGKNSPKINIVAASLLLSIEIMHISNMI